MLDTPVLLLVYDRPDLTRRVCEAVRRAGARRVYVVADGPRAAVPGDGERCAETRAVVESVDWPGTVEREYAEANLGCRRRVASGIGWFFERVERGIVLEDDCLPHPTFFEFASRLLDLYADDERVMHVCGSNFLGGRPAAGGASWYFSRYPTVWGWASWRRAWRHYDASLERFPSFARDGRLRELFPRAWERTFWADALERTRLGRIDTWDHPWTFTLWDRGGLAAVPAVNLVENLGARGDATHMRRGAVPPPLDPRGLDPERLAAPSAVAADREADTRTLRAFLRFFSVRSRLRLAWHTARALAAGDAVPGPAGG